MTENHCHSLLGENDSVDDNNNNARLEDIKGNCNFGRQDKNSF